MANLGCNRLDSITAIFFDLDNTLLDHTYASKMAKRELYQQYQAVFGHIPFDELFRVYNHYNDLLWKQLEQGTVTREYVRYQRFANLLAHFGLPPDLARTLGEKYLGIYGRYWRLYEGVPEVLEYLRSQYPLGLITNGFADVQHQKINQFDLKPYFQVILISDEIGVMKPHRGIFDTAAHQVEQPPDHLLFVGDSYTSDIQGAHQCGWKTVWVRPATQARPDSVADAEVESITELVEML